MSLVLSLVACGLLSRSPDVEAGKRLYLDGIRANGEPAVAVVLTGVKVAGDQAECASCHGKSGLGTEEGGFVTPAVAGHQLFDLDRIVPQQTPGYTPQAFARALREGLDSAGRPMEELMPRYPSLSDHDISSLYAYLETIGRLDEEGQGDGFVDFATVLSVDVSADRRQAIVDVLDKYAEVHNDESLNTFGVRRFGKVDALNAYRRWRIRAWEVSGPPDTWPAQLDRHYDAQPVFGLLSGIADGPWQPVHDFCERRGLPCLLPITDEPPPDPDEGLTLYYSGGIHLEARVLASLLPTSSVVQLVAPGDAKAARFAAALEEQLDAREMSSEIVELPPDRVPEGGAWVVWGPATGLAELPPGPPVFVSTTFTDPLALPEPLRSRTTLVSRFTMPGRSDSGSAQYEAWARPRGVQLRHTQLQARAWFAAYAMDHALVETADRANRRYTIDYLDHSARLNGLAPLHPRAEFGPDQRTLSKGMWVWPADGETNPRFVIP